MTLEEALDRIEELEARLKEDKKHVPFRPAHPHQYMREKLNPPCSCTDQEQIGLVLRRVIFGEHKRKNESGKRTNHIRVSDMNAREYEIYISAYRNIIDVLAEGQAKYAELKQEVKK